MKFVCIKIPDIDRHILYQNSKYNIHLVVGGIYEGEYDFTLIELVRYCRILNVLRTSVIGRESYEHHPETSFIPLREFNLSKLID